MDDIVLQFVVKMVVDEDKEYALSNYSVVGGKACKKDSDHNTMYVDLSVSVPKVRVDRTEVYNFKNKECQQKFLEVTNNTTKLSDCFDNDENIHNQGRKWFKSLNGLFQQSFKKIRVTSVQKETTVSKLFDKRRELIQKLKTANEEEQEELSAELDVTEENIAKEVSKDARDEIVDTIRLDWIGSEESLKQ